MVKNKKILSKAGFYVLVLAAVTYILGPIYWLVISSISPQVELLSVPPHWIPQHPTFTYYYRIFFSTSGLGGAFYQFKVAMLNSFTVAISVTAVCLFVGSLSAYAFARLNFKGKNSLIYIVLFTELLPTIAISVPVFVILRQLGLLDNKLGLILVYTSFSLPFVVWVLQGYFRTIPKDLEESARIDGSSRVGALFKIIMPIATPGLFATGVFAFLGAWNEFLLALVLTSSAAAKTMPVALAEFLGRFTIDYGLLITGGVIAVTPPIILSLIFQKYLVEGLSAGSVKG